MPHILMSAPQSTLLHCAFNSSGHAVSCAQCVEFAGCVNPPNEAKMSVAMDITPPPAAGRGGRSRTTPDPMTLGTPGVSCGRKLLDKRPDPDLHA